ncbi:Pao retrotransposon peptidase, partial [Ostertagia ostertagi]
MNRMDLSDNYKVALSRLHQLYNSLRKNNEDMSMNIREFATNSVQLRSRIPEKDRSNAAKVKLLGILWDTGKDHLLLQSKLEFQNNPTKRSVLRTIHSNFDPLGFLIPLLIPARVFLQSLWAKGYEWDDQLSNQDIKCWESTCRNADAFFKRLHRSICPSNPVGKLEICTFADASNNAYATCCYLRKIHGNTIESELICAKYRLAPISHLTQQRTLTTPKLELLALLIASQLTDFICNELDLPIDTIRIFSDSNIALSQLHSGQNAGTFVNNRVRKMRALYESWQRKKMKWSESEVLTQLHCVDVNEHSTIFRYGLSNWTKMKRATAIVLKFIKIVSKSRYKDPSSQNREVSLCSELYHVSENRDINAKDLQLAENVLIRDHYRSMTEKQLQSFKHLNLVSKNHIYRCRGRLENSQLAFEATNPILLLPNHALTRLIIKDTHEKIGHQGVNATLSEIQRNYWIPHEELLRETKNSLARFWEMWSQLYLTSLQFLRSSLTTTRSSRIQPHVGAVVLIEDSNKPRSQWNLGIITALHPGADKIIRSVSVRKANRIITKRSINQLIPLEISSYEETVQKIDESESRREEKKRESESQPVPIRKQPPRSAKKHVRYAENIDVIPSFFSSIASSPLLLITVLVIAGLVTPSSALSSSANSPSLEVLCIKGGVSIRNLIPLSDVQACAQNHCIETRVFDEETTVMFPASVCLHAYDVRVKASFEHENIIRSVTCPPSPFCEMIDYYFCSLMINNPTCWPRTAIAIVVLVLYGFITSAIVFVCFCRRLIRSTRILWGHLFRSCSDTTENVPLVAVSPHRTQLKRSAFVTVFSVVMISVVIPPILSCQEAFTVSTDQLECSRNNFDCHFTKNALLKISPLSNEACVTIVSNGIIKEQIRDHFITNYLACNLNILSTLPLTFPNFLIEPSPKGSQYPIVTTQLASLEIAISMNISNARLSNIVDTFNCSIVTSPLTGCYGCTQGATASFSCQSDLENTLAQIDCATHSFAIPCSQNSKTTVVRFSFSVAQIKEICKARCGSNT